jgi:hypothetical protein
MNPPPRPPLFVLLFQGLFGVIGLTLLGFLWLGGDAFPAPLFFRIFASFIALGFVLVGFGAPLHALRHAGQAAADPGSSTRAGGTYDCPNCGAGLGRVDVSPSGDVKCSYCARWFNIHAQT